MFGWPIQRRRKGWTRWIGDSRTSQHGDSIVYARIHTPKCMLKCTSQCTLNEVDFACNPLFFIYFPPFFCVFGIHGTALRRCATSCRLTHHAASHGHVTSRCSLWDSIQPHTTFGQCRPRPNVNVRLVVTATWMSLKVNKRACTVVFVHQLCLLTHVLARTHVLTHARFLFLFFLFFFGRSCTAFDRVLLF
jgi:hypothetical protein